MSTTLTLSDTAEKHDVAKSSLSEAVHEGRPVRDMNLHRYAITKNGRIQEFRFPAWYNFPNEREKEGREETIFMTLLELCEQHEGFHRGKVEEALRSGRRIDGNDIRNWAVRDEEGALKGFEVPKNADLDGPCHFRDPAAEVDSEGAEETQKNRLNRSAPGEGEEPSREGEHRASPEAARSFSALAGAAVLKLLTS
jgi:hypothetical protein